MKWRPWDKAGRNRIDSDSARCHLFGQRTGESTDRRLGGRIRHIALASTIEGRQARNIRDTPALPEMREHRPGAAERCREVDGEHPLPVRIRHVRHLHPPHQPSGIVHTDIHTT